MSNHTNDRAEAKTSVQGMNYRKVEEQTATSYDEAQTKADTLFAPFGAKDVNGSRTSAEAKVRVRLRRGEHGQPDSFRVVLYKHLSTFKNKEEKKAEDAPDKTAKKTRHRNDRKGRKGKPRERQTSKAG